MGKPTKVVIDLGGLEFSEKELTELESALQATVLSKLGGFTRDRSPGLGFIPASKKPGWIGLVIRDLKTLNVADATLADITKNIGQH